MLYLCIIMLKRIASHILVVSVLAILTACGSSRTTRIPANNYTPDKGSGISKDNNDNDTYMAPQSAALINKARSWLGTPYRYGGNDRRGIDCSGLVLQVYKDALGIQLPRNSREQHDYCSSVSKGGMVPGDLIFFATGKNKRKVSHVGIFVGGNQMIHASTSQGVIISDINSSYYSRTYVGAGMVDKYHAMIGDAYKKNNKNKPDKHKKENDSRHEEPSSRDIPEIHISQLESPAGFTLTPVEELPQPKQQTPTAASGTEQKPETQKNADRKTPQSQPEPTQQKTVQVATISNQPAEQPTAEEARKSVLSSLKEKEL